MDSENSSDDNDNKRTSTHYKKVKQNITQQESRKSSRKISRHRRISAPDNYNPTMIRNIENTEMIEEYEVTEKIPMEIIYSNKSKYKLNESEAQKDYWKYSQKYDIVKNCKYSNENNTNQTIENSGMQLWIKLS